MVSPYLLALALVAGPAPEPRAGGLVDGIVCRLKPQWTYALFVPEGYTHERTWPILYVFDPRSRGAVAAEPFLKAAAARGYVVASSNHTESDNPEAPNAEVINELWRDTHERLRLDEKRTYLAGFSGTARVAVNIAVQLPGKVAGVVACGAGYPPDEHPRKGLSFSIFGAIGERDFNYYEVRDLADELARLELPHRVASFDGDHQWLDAVTAELALEWLDIEAMRGGTLARDEARLAAHRERALVRASELEKQGQRVEAYREVLATERDLRGLADVASLSAAAERLRKAGVQKELEAERKRDRRDLAYQRQVDLVFGHLMQDEDPPTLGALRADLHLADLQREAAGPQPASAQRRLAHVFVRSAFYIPRELRQRGDHRRAALCFQIATEVRPGEPGPWWGLARARARIGARAEALAALRKAVEAGFHDRERIGREPDLASLAADPGFQELLASLPPG
jgi:predicted esterase